MSILGLMENTADIAQTTPQASAVPSTHGERFGATFEASQSPDRYWNAQAARIARADKIIGAVHALTGERHLNPYDTANPLQDEMDLLPAEIQARRLQTLREAARTARAKTEQFGGMADELLDPDTIDPGIAAESRALRGREARLVGTGGGLGGFVGGMVGETLSPHGIASTFIPVSRMPTAIIQGTIAGFARNVGREALFQAAAGMAVQAPGTAIDYQTRKAFGTEQTTAEIVEEILGAGVGGALLGGGFRAAHLGILKLASRGVEIHPAVRDAAVLEEGADLHGTKNPLRVPAGVNEANLDAAVGNVALGRAATPDLSGVGPQGLDDAARRLAPELAARYDAAIVARDEARAILAQALPPVPDGMVRMFHGGENATAGGPRDVAATFDYARNFGTGNKPVWYVDVPVDSPWLRQVDVTGTNMPRSFMNSVAPEEVMAGAKLVPGPSQSLRQQLQAADLELRDLIPEINAAMRAAGAELATPARAILAPDAEAPTAASLSEARLTPDEISRVRELQDQIPDYERLRDAATTPEDKAAWQTAIDAFNSEIARIMDLDVVGAGLKQLQPEIIAAQRGQATTQAADMQRPFVAQPAEARPGRVAAESAQDKAMDSQVKLLLERPDGATPEQRQAYAKALDDEKEARVALSCVGGAPI